MALCAAHWPPLSPFPNGSGGNASAALEAAGALGGTGVAGGTASTALVRAGAQECEFPVKRFKEILCERPVWVMGAGCCWLLLPLLPPDEWLLRLL